MLGRGHRAVLVTSGQALLGIATVTDIRKQERDAWRTIPIGELMTPRESIVGVAPELSALEVLCLLGEKRLNQVPVLADGIVLGMISRHDLVERLSVNAALDGQAHASPDAERESAPRPPLVFDQRGQAT
jgi:CBS domain-containing protein